jgi:CheY-like chemotaxis protein
VAALGAAGDGTPVRPLALLVEDSPDVLATTSRFLEAAGFHVVRAGNGQEAMAPLASGQEFALLVTDYAMPGLNGVDLALRALAMHPELKVLIITGFPCIEGLSALPPAVVVLLKPFRREELLAQLRIWFGPQPPTPPDARD